MARWFGPKVTGYGTGPQSWQGWLASAIVVAIVVSLGLFDVRTLGLPEWTKAAAMFAIIAAFLLLVRATYSAE
jgi:L-asparagine transporter-like permease